MAESASAVTHRSAETRPFAIGRRAVLPVVAIILIAAIALVGVRVYMVANAYSAAVGRLDDLRALSTTGKAGLSQGEEIQRAQADLQDMQAQLERLDQLTTPPVGAAMLARVPWFGPRYQAARGLVEIGLLGADAGTRLTDIGQDVLPLLDAGLLSSASDSGPSWLDAVAQHQDSLTQVDTDLSTIAEVRSHIDESVLPARFQSRLAQLDTLLANPQVKALTSIPPATALRALGADTPARYLVAFQNPAELRPSGGFPGTMALVIVSHGRLQSYQFFDAHALSDVYVENRSTRLEQPWAMAQFFPQRDGFLLHDALWWPDFPRSAQQLMDMYAQTGWPAIDGVIAVQPQVASQLMGVTGSFTVDFEGQQHVITSDNVYDEINRLRGTRNGFPDASVVHKDMLGLIGQTMIDRLKSADRQKLVDMLGEFGTDCQQRNIQVYMADPQAEALLDQQHCTGRLLPVPGEPTLAVTFANVALSKTSMDMRPRLTLTAGPELADGEREMRLDIDMRDGAVAADDPIYAGFQRWWVEVHLPEGSTLLSDPGPMHDPDAPNGGSYLAALFPDQTGTINIRFAMPDAQQLLIRRQAGVAVGDVRVVDGVCDNGLKSELNRDLQVDLTTLCTSG